jgi:hypothetical protein
MALGAMASIFAAAWRFLEIRQAETTSTLDTLCILRARIRRSESEADLIEIEDEVDAILQAELAATRGGDEDTSDAAALIAAAQRIDNLVHHRRAMLAAKAAFVRDVS